MFELKYYKQTSLNPLEMNIPKPFLITGSHIFFRGLLSHSQCTKERTKSKNYLTNKDPKFCFIFIVQGSP